MRERNQMKPKPNEKNSRPNAHNTPFSQRCTNSNDAADFQPDFNSIIIIQ